MITQKINQRTDNYQSNENKPLMGIGISMYLLNSM